MKRIESMSPRSRQLGVSLIELMVAALLGLIIVAGLIQVLIANRRAYQVQQGSNYLQQNLRFANDTISWSVRMAGFWGGVAPNEVTGLTTSSGATPCSDAWLLSAQGGLGSGAVQGADGAAAFPYGSCVAAANYVKGSDVLVLRYADADPCAVDTGATALNTSTCLPASTYYLAANVGQTGQIFKAGASVPTLPGSTHRYVYPYRVDMYYLQPCSDNGGGNCTATSDGGTPQPTLMRMSIVNGKFQAFPIVSGIEQLQFEYGIYVSNGAQNEVPSIKQYKTAAQMTAADWQNVLAVRMTMVARGRERDLSIPQGGTFALTGTCSYTISTAGAFTLSSTSADCDGFTMNGLTRPDQFVRTVLQQTVQLRNISRGG
ncbi:PilW family protein [Dyella sp.]|uniref:PilW family protein n=1 Tax=Dyella sp. TaxID=1869338 RepID=UPI002ED38FEF